MIENPNELHKCAQLMCKIASKNFSISDWRESEQYRNQNVYKFDILYNNNYLDSYSVMGVNNKEISYRKRRVLKIFLGLLDNNDYFNYAFDLKCGFYKNMSHIREKINFKNLKLFHNILLECDSYAEIVLKLNMFGILLND